MTILVASVPLLFTVIGFIIWVATDKAPAKEAGRLLFLAGLIGLAVLSGHGWRIG